MKKISFGSWAFLLGPYSFEPVPFDKTARRVAEAGYDAIEISGHHSHVSLKAYPTKESRTALKQMLDELGLERSGYGCDQRPFDPTEARNKEKYLDRFSRNLEMCNDLAVKDIRVDTIAPPNKYRDASEHEAAMGRAAEVFHAAAQKAQEAGVRLHWEFEPAFIFNKPSEIVALHEKVAHPNFDIMFDTSHAYVCAVTGARQHGKKETLDGGVEALLAILEGKIGAIHLTDSDGTLHDDRTSTHNPFGTGYIGFPSLAPKLLALPNVDYWTIDMCFWPAAWELMEAQLEYVKELLSATAPAAAAGSIESKQRTHSKTETKEETKEMTTNHQNNYPKLHNAAWPGVVGKGPDSEPPIDLDTMLDLTAGAEVDGVKFEGVDLFLHDPHIDIDISDDDLKKWADKFQSRGLVIGSVVAPVWPPTGGGSAMDPGEGRKKFLSQVHKGCRIAKKLREFGVRPYGVVRIDSATGVTEWADGDREEHNRTIAETFRQACGIAEDFGERLAAEGEICWGGMHSWKQMVNLLEQVDRPNIGFQADMAHTLLYTLGYNAPEDAILPQDFAWDDPARLDEALKKVTGALRPWTIDFHVAQNDATVKGSGSHDKTGRHCLATDPNGKLDIPRHAGFWLRDDKGELTKACRHICWDGCMFPNEIMMKRETWNDILRAMISVRDAHGWREEE